MLHYGKNLSKNIFYISAAVRYRITTPMAFIPIPLDIKQCVTGMNVNWEISLAVWWMEIPLGHMLCLIKTPRY